MAGVEAFSSGLQDLDYVPENPGPNRVVFEYQIKQGRFAEKTIKIGIEVPPDFPVNCPTGPHINPRLIPIDTGALDNKRAAESPFGPEWQYLSRPFRAQQTGWNRTKRDVKSYLWHVMDILNTL